jgi:hypothetical protein
MKALEESMLRGRGEMGVSQVKLGVIFNAKIIMKKWGVGSSGGKIYNL